MSGMFSRPQPIIQQAAPVAAPEVKPPAPMPDTSSAGAVEARRRTQLDIMSRAGRTSTILTAPDKRNNSNNAYTSTQLGAGN